MVCLGLDQIPGLGDERQMSCAHDFKPYCFLESMLCRWYSCGSQFQLQFPPSVQSVPRIFYVSGTTGQHFQMLHIRTEMAPAPQAAASLGAAGRSWCGSGCWVPWCCRFSNSRVEQAGEMLSPPCCHLRPSQI